MSVSSRYTETQTVKTMNLVRQRAFINVPETKTKPWYIEDYLFLFSSRRSPLFRVQKTGHSRFKWISLFLTRITYLGVHA